jgi:hypothetical protein
MRVARFILLGAGAYWVPDILTQWVRPPDHVWIALLTFAVPLCVVSTWVFLSRRPENHKHLVALPLLMALGIWIVGPLAIAVGMLPAGGTMLRPENIREFLLLWAVFPISTFSLSTYSGSLGGLLLTTAILLAVAGVASYRVVASNNRMERTRER